MSESVSLSAFVTRDSGSASLPNWPRKKCDLTSRFDMNEEIGRGGFGRVFRVHDKWLQLDVALKLTNSADSLVNEVQRLRELPKRYFVQTFDYGRISQTSYYVMELLHHADGWHSLEEFSSVMDKHGITANEAAIFSFYIIMQVCYGLTYLHNAEEGSAERFHGDLKPTNIFFNVEAIKSWKIGSRYADNPFVKIIDLGVSGVSGQPSTACTPRYAPPEQTSWKRCTKKVDSYAVGKILAELMSHQKLDLSDYNSKKKLTSNFNSNISLYLRSIAAEFIFRLIAKRPSDRVMCEQIGDELYDFFQFKCTNVVWSMIGEFQSIGDQISRKSLARKLQMHIIISRNGKNRTARNLGEANEIISNSVRQGIIAIGKRGHLTVV